MRKIIPGLLAQMVSYRAMNALGVDALDLLIMQLVSKLVPDRHSNRFRHYANLL